MSDQDQRDVRAILDEREDLKKQLDSAREQLREQGERAGKVPHLESELERFQKQQAKADEDAKRRTKENGDLETRNRELESELRDRNSQIKELSDALASTEDNEDSISELKAQASTLQQQLAAANSLRQEQEKEVERLRKIEEAAKEDLRTRDALRDHLGSA